MTPVIHLSGCRRLSFPNLAVPVQVHESQDQSRAIQCRREAIDGVVGGMFIGIVLQGPLSLLLRKSSERSQQQGEGLLPGVLRDILVSVSCEIEKNLLSMTALIDSVWITGFSSPSEDTSGTSYRDRKPLQAKHPFPSASA